MGNIGRIEVANTNIGFRFAGANLAERLQNVEAMANALSQGNIGIEAFIDAPGVAPGTLSQELLGTTTSVEVDEIAFEEFRHGADRFPPRSLAPGCSRCSSNDCGQTAVKRRRRLRSRQTMDDRAYPSRASSTALMEMRDQGAVRSRNAT